MPELKGSRWCLDFTRDEIKAIYAAAEREGCERLVAHWMKRVLLEKANSFNFTVRDPDAPTESWGAG